MARSERLNLPGVLLSPSQRFTLSAETADGPSQLEDSAQWMLRRFRVQMRRPLFERTVWPRLHFVLALSSFSTVGK